MDRHMGAALVFLAIFMTSCYSRSIGTGHDVSVSTRTNFNAFLQSLIKEELSEIATQMNPISLDEGLKPLCTGKMEYQLCGCRATCEPESQRPCGRLCQPGCYCPSGTVEHNGECIPQFQCPVCQLDSDPGFCSVYVRRELVQRYYYNPKVGDCEVFYFAECGGNENNFESYKECIQQCPRNTNVGPRCQNPAELNHCSIYNGGMRRYYYDEEHLRCFSYGACEATDDTFATQEECQTQCQECPGTCCPSMTVTPRNTYGSTAVRFDVTVTAGDCPANAGFYREVSYGGLSPTETYESVSPEDFTVEFDYGPYIPDLMDFETDIYIRYCSGRRDSYCDCATFNSFYIIPFVYPSYFYQDCKTWPDAIQIH